MSQVKFEIEATLRSELGKGASRRLRRLKQIPAIVYGAGVEPVLLSLDHNKLETALSHEATYSHILTLNIENKREKVILKAIQRDPSRPVIQHIDFLRVRADQKLTMHVPLHFMGEDAAPGVKEGGIVSHLISDVEVSCLPDALPEFIEVDLSGLQLNETLHLSNLTLPQGVELLALSHGDVEEHDLPVASVHKPRIIEEDIIEATTEPTPASDAPAATGEKAS